MPEEVENLLEVVALKGACRAAVVSFGGNHFANPTGLVRSIADQAGTVELRTDHKLVYRRS